MCTETDRVPPSASQQVICKHQPPDWQVDKSSSHGCLMLGELFAQSSGLAGYSLAVWLSSSKPRDAAAISTRKQEGQIYRSSRIDLVKSFLSKTDFPLTKRGVAGMREPTRVLSTHQVKTTHKGNNQTSRAGRCEPVWTGVNQWEPSRVCEMQRLEERGKTLWV